VAAEESALAVSAQVKHELAELSSEVEKALRKADHCRVEELDGGRCLFHSFRRQPGGAPRRLLL
jgi:hypothetical protein